MRNLAEAAEPAPLAPAAPFLLTESQAPPTAAAVWLTASDGHRLRGAVLGHGSRGTVLLLHGRTEYLEKYGLAAAEFAARGYGTVSVDFRGQGRSDRLVPDDPRIGHVNSFADYQHDVAALVDLARHQDMPQPWFLVGHSMGGAVGLRALQNGLAVRGAIFSAPMWGIAMPAALMPVAHGLGYVAHRLKLDGWVTPSVGRQSYVKTVEATDNTLTSDAAMLAYMRGHLEADTELDLGGPSMAWLYRALRECRHLASAPLPTIPSLVFLPGHESVVSPQAIQRMVQRWHGARLIEVESARHEVMMETPEIRKLFFDRSAAFFERLR